LKKKIRKVSKECLAPTFESGNEGNEGSLLSRSTSHRLDKRVPDTPPPTIITTMKWYIGGTGVILVMLKALDIFVK